MESIFSYRVIQTLYERTRTHRKRDITTHTYTQKLIKQQQQKTDCVNYFSQFYMFSLLLINAVHREKHAVILMYSCFRKIFTLYIYPISSTPHAYFIVKRTMNTPLLNAIPQTMPILQ